MRRILTLVVLLIVYGSLYPWHFAPKYRPGNPFWILLHAWQVQPPREFIRDTTINILLYIPLGAAAHFVFRKNRLPLFGFLGPVLFGLLLSTTIELTQLYTPSRDTSIIDVINNVIGSVCGVFGALLFEALAEPRTVRAFQTTVADGGALMLIFCWALSFLSPFFPVVSPWVLAQKISVFANSPVLDAPPFLTALASLYAAALLTGAWTVLLLLVIPAQFFIVEQQPLLSELFGAVAGVLLAWALSRVRATARTLAAVFLAVLVVRGLSPFHFVRDTSPFSWIPFAGTLGSDWQTALLVLVGKMFFYGSAIWLLRAGGLRWRHSATLVAAVLAAIELVQTHLPGRTPEITDPLLAILMGFVLVILSRGTEKRSRSAG